MSRYSIIQRNAHIENLLVLESYLNRINIVNAIDWAARYNHKCCYCTRELTPKNRTKEHIVPRSFMKGKFLHSFTTVFGLINTLPSCMECNTYRSNLTLVEFYEKVKSSENLPATEREIMLNQIRYFLKSNINF